MEFSDTSHPVEEGGAGGDVVHAGSVGLARATTLTHASCFGGGGGVLCSIGVPHGERESCACKAAYQLKEAPVYLCHSFNRLPPSDPSRPLWQTPLFFRAGKWLFIYLHVLSANPRCSSRYREWLDG